MIVSVRGVNVVRVGRRWTVVVVGVVMSARVLVTFERARGGGRGENLTSGGMIRNVVRGGLSDGARSHCIWKVGEKAGGGGGG